MAKTNTAERLKGAAARVPNETAIAIGKRLNAALLTRGWSQGKLARILNVAKMTVNQWIAGKSEPRVVHFLKLSHLLFQDDDRLLAFGPARQPKGGWPEPDSIGERIADALKRRGWTEALLAKKLGVQKQMVRNWVRDQREPSAAHLLSVARILFEGNTGLLVHGPAS